MKLVIQRCDLCGHAQHYPKATCGRCGGTALTLTVPVGTGYLYSYTVVHRAPAPDVAVPYVVAIVRLDEGPALLTHLVDCPLDRLRCDLPVAVVQGRVDSADPPVFAPR